MNPIELNILRDEVSLLPKFCHKNIIRHIESYEDDRYIYIVMEYMENSFDMHELI